jgi:WD40 repeat protein/tetratricopeptide (TPR) repeat protein
LSPDGKTLLTGSWGRHARLWNTATGALIGQPLAHDGPVWAAAFAPDGNSFATSTGLMFLNKGYAQLWDTATGRPRGHQLLHTNFVRALAFSPDGRTLWTGSGSLVGGGEIRTWEAATGVLPRHSVPMEVPLGAMGLSHDGSRMLSTPMKGGPKMLLEKTESRLGDTTTGKPLGAPLPHLGPVSSDEFSPDRKVVATATYWRKVQLWHADTGRPVGQPIVPQGVGLPHLAFLADGRTVVVAWGNLLSLWERHGGKMRGKPLTQPDVVTALAVSGDDQTVFAGGFSGKVWRCNLAGGRKHVPITSVEGYVNLLRLSPDGSTLLIGTVQGTARLVHVDRGQPLGPAMGHAKAEVVACKGGFSHDGKFVVTTIGDANAMVLDARTAILVGPPFRHPAVVHDLVFSKGHTFVSVSEDKVIRRWDILSGVQGSVEQVKLWVETITGIELDDANVAQVLDSKSWMERQKKCPEAHCSRGDALYRKGRLDEAIGEYQTAIRLNPGYADAHNGLGNALHDGGQLDRAIQEYRETIRLTQDAAGPHFNLGRSLLSQGQLDKALGALRRAVDLQGEFAEAHLLLGLALQQTGEFREALAALKRSHEIGSKNLKWPHPSAQWVRACERLVEFDRMLPQILAKKIKPNDAAESIEFAHFFMWKKLYGAAAHSFAASLVEQPRLFSDPRNGNRYDAACAAALAAAGKGADASQLGRRERTDFRQQTLTWLRADLETWGHLFAKAPTKVNAEVRRTMQHWQQDPDLAGIRDAATLAKLPAEEQAACKKLWADVQALLRKAQSGKNEQ